MQYFRSAAWSSVSKNSRLNLKREVSLTEKRFNIAIMFSGRQRRFREEEEPCSETTRLRLVVPLEF